MKHLYISLFVTVVLHSPLLAAGPAVSALIECQSISSDAQRLKCYDGIDITSINAKLTPRFEGKRTVKTELFSIDSPTVMRYHSDGAIFVLALHDSEGNVIQNLHIGGGGEDSYLIEKTGEYFLRVNGSTTWKIWLEPL